MVDTSPTAPGDHFHTPNMDYPVPPPEFLVPVPPVSSVVPVPPPVPPPEALAKPVPPSIKRLVHRLRSYDSETCIVTPGNGVPELVCGSVAGVAFGGEIIGKFLDRDEAIDMARQILGSDEVIIGAHIAYDLTVLANEDPNFIPIIFQAFDEARVYDVLLVQALDAVAKGHLSFRS